MCSRGSATERLLSIDSLRRPLKGAVAVSVPPCSRALPRYRLPILLALLASLLTACARSPVLTREQVPAAAPAQIELDQTPFIAQERYQCGPASLAMLLQQSGVEVSAEDLVSQVYLPKRHGSLQAEMIAASRRYQRIPYPIDPDLHALTAELGKGRPVLVLQNLGLQSAPLWHYAVVIGYSMERDRIMLRSGTQRRQLMPAWLFVKTWGGADNWGMVLLRPGSLPAIPDRQRYLAAVAAAEPHAQPSATLAAYRAALERWPEDSVAQFGHANSLYALGRLQDSATAYRHLLAQQPNHVASLNNLALVYRDLGCIQQAKATLERALAVVGEDDPLYPALLDTQNQLQEASTRAAAGDCRAGD
jgi:tetratricopeptide (TPR) repeat protein